MLIAPGAPTNGVLGESQVVDEEERLHGRIQECLKLILVRLEVLPDLVEATNDPCPDERLYLLPVMVRWHEDLVPRLEAEGLDARVQPVTG
jgi:hypothetical protein